MIYLTKKALSSMKEAIITVGHEMQHVKDYVAGLKTSAGAGPERAGQALFQKYLERWESLT